MNTTIKDLYLNELKDLYDAENQLLKALPKMAQAASSEKLRQGLEGHLEQTKDHVRRLDQIFRAVGEDPEGLTCKAIRGLVEECSEEVKQDLEVSVKDAALIGVAQRIEHYEIVAYGTACAFAKELGESGHVSLLAQTLQEENEADQKLTTLAKEINSQANRAEEDGTDKQRQVA